MYYAIVRDGALVSMHHGSDVEILHEEVERLLDVEDPEDRVEFRVVPLRNLDDLYVAIYD